MTGEYTISPGQLSLADHLADRLRAIDAYVLLRHPRVWAARAHVLLPLAALAYAALAVLTLLLLRPLLTPTSEAFVNGAQPYRGDWDAGLARQFQTSLVFTLTRNSVSNDIAIIVLAVCGAAFAAGVLCLALWLRALARHAPMDQRATVLIGELAYTPRNAEGIRKFALTKRALAKLAQLAHYAAASWAEWLMYALCAAALLGAPLWIFALLGPTPAQRAAVDEVLSASRDALLARAASSGVDPGVYLFQSNNNQPLSRIYDAGERLVGMAFFDLGQDLVVPRRLRFEARIETKPSAAQPKAIDWQNGLYAGRAWINAIAPDPARRATRMGGGQLRINWTLNPDLGPDERAYLAQLADATYARAFLAPAPAHRVIRLIYAELLFWWLVGATALWVFATRRAASRHVAGAAFGALTLGVLGALAPIATGITIAGLLAVFCAFACARALRGGVFRLVWLAGVLCAPMLPAILMLLLARGIDARAPLGVFDLLLSYRPWQYTAVPALALGALAYLPLLPVLDRALTRLHALPRLK